MLAQARKGPTTGGPGGACNSPATLIFFVDTHALIWFAENDSSLSAGARQALRDDPNELYCSVASSWEMAIKVSLGKLKLCARLEPDFRRCLEENGFTILPVEFTHGGRQRIQRIAILVRTICSEIRKYFRRKV
ncbi:MAG: type II toxin-antitoxin system VapC family toxin [Verrucomicrobiia bacterium]